MKIIFVVLAVIALSGCGVETATVAASAAIAKQKEIEQGGKTMEQMKQQIDQAAQQQRPVEDAEKKE